MIEPFHQPFMARALAELLILGALSGTVGVLVLLRRLAFVTDALTHTVFPGVVLGFMAMGADGVLWGALAAAGITAALLTLLSTRVSADVSMAMLLTSLFAFGVVLVSRRESFTADLTAFLFGRVLTVTHQQLAETAAITLVVVVALAVLRRPLLLRAFDPDGAQAMGLRVLPLDLVTNLLVALVVVAAVRTVGTILVMALLVVPAAAARALTDRLTLIVPLACGIGALSAWLGLAASYEASINQGVRLAPGGMVVLVLVAVFLLAGLASRVKTVIVSLHDRHARTAGSPPTAHPRSWSGTSPARDRPAPPHGCSAPTKP